MSNSKGKAMNREVPPLKQRLPDDVRSYSSKLDGLKGPLRTTSDGNLLKEDTGEWLVLDTPPHDSEDREIVLPNKKTSNEVPAIGLPESKNGATGLDNPRARKPLMRLLRNKLYGLDRPPVEDSNPVTEAKKKLWKQIKGLLDSGITEADLLVLSDIREHYTLQLGPTFGGDWFERAMSEVGLWLDILDEVLRLGPD